jgi:hypothetical protein
MEEKLDRLLEETRRVQVQNEELVARNEAILELVKDVPQIKATLDDRTERLSASKTIR